MINAIKSGNATPAITRFYPHSPAELIAVHNMLPPVGQLVLAWCGNHKTGKARWLLARYDSRGIWFAFYGPSTAVEVSHWCWLPRPPFPDQTELKHE